MAQELMTLFKKLNKDANDGTLIRAINPTEDPECPSCHKGYMVKDLTMVIHDEENQPKPLTDVRVCHRCGYVGFYVTKDKKKEVAANVRV